MNDSGQRSVDRRKGRQLAAAYGLPLWWLRRIGVKKFRALGEEARTQVVRQWLGPWVNRGSRKWKLRGSRRYFDRRARHMGSGEFRGRAVASWMEEFARSDMDWMRQANAQAARRERERLEREARKREQDNRRRRERAAGIERKRAQREAAQLPWLNYGDWSDEAGPKVMRMVALARKVA